MTNLHPPETPKPAIRSVLIALMLACIVLSIWGDPDLSGRYAASAFVCAFTTIAIGGAAGFLWIQWEYAPGRAA